MCVAPVSRVSQQKHPGNTEPASHRSSSHTNTKGPASSCRAASDELEDTSHSLLEAHPNPHGVEMREGAKKHMVCPYRRQGTIHLPRQLPRLRGGRTAFSFIVQGFQCGVEEVGHNQLIRPRTSSTATTRNNLKSLATFPRHNRPQAVLTNREQIWSANGATSGV